MIKKFKPFSGFCPVPVLPASQAAATSYMQHLAYLEWYIEHMKNAFENEDDNLHTGLDRLDSAMGGIEANMDLIALEILRKEDKSNKVTSIDGSSTDVQYPSAKCVYDAIQESGDVAVESGSGNLVDSMVGGVGVIGTYDFYRVGNLLTVTLHVESAPLSTGLSVSLDGLEYALDTQKFGFVQNNFGEAEVHSLQVMFYTSDGNVYASANEGGVAYISNLLYLNNATFTMRISD